MTHAELSRLRWIAKHGPVINMAVTPEDRALFNAGLIKADALTAYVTPAGLKALEGECEMIEEQAALAWLQSWENAINQYPGYNPDAHNHARIIKAMLAEPRLLKQATHEALKVMWDCGDLKPTQAAEVYRALYAHLSKPRMVKQWSVTGIDECDPRVMTSRSEAVNLAERALASTSKRIVIEEIEVPE